MRTTTRLWQCFLKRNLSNLLWISLRDAWLIQRSNNRWKEIEEWRRFTGHSKLLETVVTLGRIERMWRDEDVKRSFHLKTCWSLGDGWMGHEHAWACLGCLLQLMNEARRNQITAPMWLQETTRPSSPIEFWVRREDQEAAHHCHLVFMHVRSAAQTLRPIYFADDIEDDNLTVSTIRLKHKRTRRFKHKVDWATIVSLSFACCGRNFDLFDLQSLQQASTSSHGHAN